MELDWEKALARAMELVTVLLEVVRLVALWLTFLRFWFDSFQRRLGIVQAVVNGLSWCFFHRFRLLGQIQEYVHEPVHGVHLFTTEHSGKSHLSHGMGGGAVQFWIRCPDLEMGGGVAEGLELGFWA
jgi:hypothetical protein